MRRTAAPQPCPRVRLSPRASLKNLGECLGLRWRGHVEEEVLAQAARFVARSEEIKSGVEAPPTPEEDQPVEPQRDAKDLVPRPPVQGVREDVPAVEVGVIGVSGFPHRPDVWNAVPSVFSRPEDPEAAGMWLLRQVDNRRPIDLVGVDERPTGALARGQSELAEDVLEGLDVDRGSYQSLECPDVLEAVEGLE